MEYPASWSFDSETDRPLTDSTVDPSLPWKLRARAARRRMGASRGAALSQNLSPGTLVTSKSAQRQRVAIEVIARRRKSRTLSHGPRFNSRYGWHPSPPLRPALLHRSALGFPRRHCRRHEHRVVRVRRSICPRAFSASAPGQGRAASVCLVGGQCVEVVPTPAREVPGRKALPLESVRRVRRGVSRATWLIAADESGRFVMHRYSFVARAPARLEGRPPPPAGRLNCRVQRACCCLTSSRPCRPCRPCRPPYRRRPAPAARPRSLRS